MLSTGIPQGFVLGPSLFPILRHNCASRIKEKLIINSAESLYSLLRYGTLLN